MKLTRLSRLSKSYRLWRDRQPLAVLVVVGLSEMAAWFVAALVGTLAVAVVFGAPVMAVAWVAKHTPAPYRGYLWGGVIGAGLMYVHFKVREHDQRHRR
ncbi:MAG: hypothetical protein M3O70_02535 [Actinomycetota bacterium]|nr:hypothetical protein [Actinomycetota bacterium]